MITTITGPQGSGKTTMAQAIINGRKFIEIFGSDVEDLTSNFFKNNDVDVILIDEVVSVDQVDYIITSKTLFHGFKKPEIIIVSSVLRKVDFLKYEKQKLLVCVSSKPEKYKDVPYPLYVRMMYVAIVSCIINLLSLLCYLITF